MSNPSSPRKLLLDKLTSSNRQKRTNNVYKIKSYLPDIGGKASGDIMNITRQALDRNQMLYLDLYEGSGIKLMEPYDQQVEQDDNLVYGKVKVVELANLSQRCRRTLSYFNAGKSQKVRRDSLRKNIYLRLNQAEEDNTANTGYDNSPSMSKDNSIKRIPMNVTQRNRRLPKREKYLIHKLGIVTGDHMFKVESNHNLSQRAPSLSNQSAVISVPHQTLRSKKGNPIPLRSSRSTSYKQQPPKIDLGNPVMQTLGL